MVVVSIWSFSLLQSPQLATALLQARRRVRCCFLLPAACLPRRHNRAAKCIRCVFWPCVLHDMNSLRTAFTGDLHVGQRASVPAPAVRVRSASRHELHHTWPAAAEKAVRLRSAATQQLPHNAGRRREATHSAGASCAPHGESAVGRVSTSRHIPQFPRTAAAASPARPSSSPADPCCSPPAPGDTACCCCGCCCCPGAGLPRPAPPAAEERSRR